MSERKSINKYYPPSWDPSQDQKKKRKSSGHKVRLMLPFSMKCLHCTEYISARRKFNARKELTSEEYMTFKIIRFHIRCPRCNNNIVFRTDPKSAGFAMVEGGVRNYEGTSEGTTEGKIELQDEILQRLEREDLADKKFQEQKQKRKNNPFWQEQKNDGTMESLEERLIEQQRHHEAQKELMQLQERAEKVEKRGGAEALLADLQPAKRPQVAKVAIPSRVIMAAKKVLQMREKVAARRTPLASLQQYSLDED